MRRSANDAPPSLQTVHDVNNTRIEGERGLHAGWIYLLSTEKLSFAVVVFTLQPVMETVQRIATLDLDLSAILKVEIR